MKREQAAYLLGGIAFGMLLGFGVFQVVSQGPHGVPPVADQGIPSPAGPLSPTQTGPSGSPPQDMGGGAPMMQEIESLRRAVQEHPDDAASWGRLANLYHDAGMYPQAAKFYEKALALEPGSADVLTDLGICYQAVGRYDEALDMFRRAQRADPAHWQSLFNEAVVAVNLGRFEEAVTAIEKLERINPAAPNLGELRKALERQRAGGA